MRRFLYNLRMQANLKNILPQKVCLEAVADSIHDNFMKRRKKRTKEKG